MVEIYNKEVTEVHPQIIEAREVVGVYEFSIEKSDGNSFVLKIKVVKIRDFFEGLANLEVKGKGCASFYRGLNTRGTKQEALEEAIRGFFAFYSEEAEVREVKDW